MERCASQGRNCFGSWRWGLLLLTGNNVLLGWGERFVTAGYAALLAASVPMLIALFESFIPGGVPLNRAGWAGTMLGLGGLLLLLAPVLRGGLVPSAGGVATRAADHALAMGTSILGVAILAWVAGSLLAGRWPSKIDPMLASAWQMSTAGAVNVAIGTAAGGWQSAHWTPGLGLALLWLTVFGSLVGYSAYTYLLARVPVAKVATYAYVNPIVAVGLSAIFLHESPARIAVGRDGCNPGGGGDRDGISRCEESAGGGDGGCWRSSLVVFLGRSLAKNLRGGA